ncbi:calcium-binding protein [Actinoplanes sp. NPDC048796]|uniref:calcium-binding protein n=1 Tax=unclassified Actinoplanes TaxID=2626549 RepID=UPI0033E08F14
MRRSPWPARIVIPVAATLSAGAVAAPAQAATIGTVSVERSTVVAYVADRGTARHNVGITRSGRTITVDDSVPVKAGKGCVAVKGDRTRARCTLKANPTWLRVVLGGYNDILVNRTDVSMTANGGAGNDRITGGSRRDIIDGNAGSDAIWGLAGNDDISDPDGANALSGGDGDDVVVGGWGNDRLYGGNGHDELNGFLGNDVEDGGPGNDHFSQNDNPNRADADTFVGGAGFDTVSYVFRTKPVTADADSVRGDDGVPGERDTISTTVEAIMGGYGNDRLIGTPRADYLYGEGGHDVLTGAAGNDLLIGGTGRDSVNGGAGTDQCERASGDTVVACEAS